MKKNILTLLVTLVLAGMVSAQDIHFSQFYMSPLTQNPAMAGASYDLFSAVQYKQQWRAVGAPFRTIAATADMRLGKKGEKGFWAAGINFFSDKSGDGKLVTTQANVTTAYHIMLGRFSTLGMGVQGGYAQRTVNPTAFQWGEQYDGNAYNSGLPTGESVPMNKFGYADMGVGLVWNYNNNPTRKEVTDNHEFRATAGFGIFHPHQPKYSFFGSDEKLYMKYVFHGSALISLKNSNIAFAPGFVYYRQGPAQEIYAGSLIRFGLRQDSKYTGYQSSAAFYLGAYVRAKDAVVISSLIEYANYAIGISYDVNTSQLQTASEMKGGLEITLRYTVSNLFSGGGISSF
jgi:type IX secretion system PorP/SprF family membrane protein